MSHLFVGSSPMTLPAGIEGQILVPAEQGRQLVVQVAPAVEAGIHDERLLAALAAQDFRERVAVTLVVHAADVDIAELAAGEFVHLLPPGLDPALVEEFLLVRQA